MHVSRTSSVFLLIILFPILLPYKLVMLTVGNHGSINATHHILTVLIECPIRLVLIVISLDAVYKFNVKTVGSLLSADKSVLKECFTESLLIGVNCKIDSVTFGNDLYGYSL